MSRNRNGSQSGTGAILCRKWARIYKDRMNQGLEYCRKCDVKDNLTFGHLISMANGGTFSFGNITILCHSCNQKQGIEIWPELISLLEEELNSSIDKQYGLSLRTPNDIRRLIEAYSKGLTFNG